MAIDDLLDILGLKEGETIELNVIINSWPSLQFDLFQIAALDMTKLKRIVFDFGSFNTTLSQGKTILEYLGVNTKTTFDPTKFLSERMIEEFLTKVNSNFNIINLQIIPHIKYIIVCSKWRKQPTETHGRKYPLKRPRERKS